jgi:hypothetical protein
VLSTHILVADPNNHVARSFQEPGPCAVIVPLRIGVVHIPVELDHDPATGTKKVYDEAVQYMLPPKLQAEDAAVAQQRPRVPFSWSGAVAKFTGARRSLRSSEPTKGIHRLSVPDN